MRPVSSALLALSLAFVACSSGSDGDVDEPRPTTIEVSAEAFLGAFTCESLGLDTYVVTLEDTEPEEVNDAGVSVVPELRSSPPTLCERTAVFGEVRPDFGIRAGRQYRVLVDGYDQAELTPAEPGSPLLNDTDGARVEPAWQWTCPALRAEFRQTRRATRCTPLVPIEPSAPSVTE